MSNVFSNAFGGSGGAGADGASAYEVAVSNGFSGTEAAWLASLEGADGVDGADGSDGASLPTQSGQTGKYLTTNGSAASWGTVASGGVNMTSNSTAPTSPAVGDQWYDTANGVLYVRVTDGTDAAWLDISSANGTAAAAGGGGWEEITTGTITSNTASLEFTGISTDFNFLRLYMTDIEYSPAAPNYLYLGVSSSDSFSTQLTWRANHTFSMTSASAVEMNYGTNQTGVTLTDSNLDNINGTANAFTFVLDIFDIQDKPYMSLEAIIPDDGARWGTAKAHGCSDRIQSIRLYNALGTSRYFTAGAYKLYGMK